MWYGVVWQIGANISLTWNEGGGIKKVKAVWFLQNAGAYHNVRGHIPEDTNHKLE
jgi:hypothetical protein